MGGMNPLPSILAIMNRPWLVASLLGLVTFVVFSPAVFYDFVSWDDDRYVYENPLVLCGLSPRGVYDAFTQTVFYFWAPLTILSYQFDASIFGREAWGFHLTNVLLHAASVACLFLVLARMTGCPGRSAVATLLFAVHPLRVESVAWVAERKDVLSMLFLIVTIMAYERYCRAPSVPRYLMVMATLLASLLAKAMAVTLPVLLVLLDWWPLARVAIPGSTTSIPNRARADPYPVRSLQGILAEKIPLLIMAGLFVLITLTTHAPAIASEAVSPLLTKRLPQALFSAIWYFWKTAWPADLHPAHLAAEATQPWCIVTLCACLLAAIVTAGVQSAKRLPAVSMGLAWFGIALLPVLGVVAQVGVSAFTDRFTYLPHIGLSIAIVWGGWAIAQQLGMSPRTAVAVVAMVAIGLIVRCESQLAIWRNSATLWSHVLALEPDNCLARYQYGEHLRRSGDLPAAIAQLRHTVQTMEDMHLNAQKRSAAHNALGVALRDADREADAAEHFNVAASLDPTNYRARTNIGMMHLSGGRLDKAVEQFETIVAERPHDPDALHHLVIAHALRGDLPAAILACRQLVAVRPTAAEPHSRLGQLLLKNGQPEAANEEFLTAQRIDPQYPGILKLLNQSIEEQSRRRPSLGQPTP